MIIRAVLFDLDGTLVDSLEDLTDAVNHVRDAFSQPPLSADAVRKKIGKGSRNLVQQVLPDIRNSDIDRALCMFLDFNRQHIADKSILYPGIREILNELAARDFKMAVLTNKNEDLCKILLQSLRIQDLFKNVCGGDTYPERKPSPLPLLKAMNALGIAPQESVMVGDSINDILAAQRADISSIACSWGYGGQEELAGADVLVHTPHELLSVITEGVVTRL
jgi:phosphoglycolate phosphatase